MTQNATPEQLSAAQEAALQALLAGQTVSAAAFVADVHRSTVHRWLKDPTFVAELNTHRTEMLNAAIGRLGQLQMTALDVIESALEDRDSRTAIAILRGGGLLDGRRQVIGPTDPERVAKDQQTHEQTQRLLDSLAQF